MDLLKDHRKVIMRFMRIVLYPLLLEYQVTMMDLPLTMPANNSALLKKLQRLEEEIKKELCKLDKALQKKFVEEMGLDKSFIS